MVKTLLINHFDDQLAFMYPKDKRKSQMFYLSSVQTADVIETIRVNDPVEVCVKKLKSECKSYDFQLNESFRNSSDLKIAIIPSFKVCSSDPSNDVESLRNTHEEADDRMMYHIHQSVTTENIERVILASGDTDVFVCSIYHYSRWMYRGLKELWIVSGNSDSKTVPIHRLAEKLSSDAIDILPAVHALTGLFLIEIFLDFNFLRFHGFSS